jgi:Universal stress protein family
MAMLETVLKRGEERDEVRTFKKREIRACTRRWHDHRPGDEQETSQRVCAVDQESAHTMLNVERILLPVDFPNASLRGIHEAATLARHFRSEIMMLHVVTPLSHLAGVLEGGADADLLAEVVTEAQETAADLWSRSLMALPFGGCWSKEIRPRQSCKWLSMRKPT